MRPALSVLLLTTLIGAGQGLFLALFLIELLALAGIVPAQDGHRFYASGSLLALLFLAAGLVASFFHLGRPERAWRAAAMWRTSWLSREVIVLPLFMGLVFLFGVAHVAGERHRRAPSRRCARARRRRHACGLRALRLHGDDLRVPAIPARMGESADPCQLRPAQGLASGFTLAATFSAMAAPELVLLLVRCAIALTVLAGLCRVASLVRNARLRPKSTLQTAIGIKHPRIVQRSHGIHGRLVQHARILPWPCAGGHLGR